MYSKWIWVAQPTSTQINSDWCRMLRNGQAQQLVGSGGWFIFKPVPSVVNSRFFLMYDDVCRFSPYATMNVDHFLKNQGF